MSSPNLPQPPTAVKGHRVCQREGCAESLEGKRSDATFCSRACKEAAWRGANTEKVRQQQAARGRQWRAANPEKVRQYSREGKRRRRAANPEKALQQDRENRRRWPANPEKARARTRAWRAANPTRRREQARQDTNRRRARKAAVHEPWTRIEVLAITDGFCSYCSCALTDATMHVDHAHPISKGGPDVLANLQPLCKRDNLRKNAKVVPQEALDRWGFDASDINVNAWFDADSRPGVSTSRKTNRSAPAQDGASSLMAA